MHGYSVDLWATGIASPAGHRIGAGITPGSLPRQGRNPDTGGDGARSSRAEVARQTVLHDPERPSGITPTVVVSG